MEFIQECNYNKLFRFAIKKREKKNINHEDTKALRIKVKSCKLKAKKKRNGPDKLD